MQVDTTKKLFTVADYHRMRETGIIAADERVELIEGEVVKMSPIGDAHAIAVNMVTDLFTGAFRGRAIVSVQNPLRLSDYTEVQPDLVLLKYRPDFYKARRWVPEDSLLVLEVADTTFRMDTRVKLPLYAKAGVAEVWIENLKAGELLVFRDPAEGAYKTSRTFTRGELVALSAFPQDPLKTAGLLP